jgi:glyoxylase-like metal-dependent hydrolase (beta-lactamase superfamily II)
MTSAPDDSRLAEGAWLLALRTPTLPPATHTNTLIVGGDRLLVIEPASPHADEQARLEALLEQLRAEGRSLAGIVLTHHHVDHVGHAERLRDRLATPILAHPATAARLDFAVDQTIDEGWSLALGDGARVAALHTPGHAPGHLVIWEQQSGIAHVGDLVAGQGTILVDPSDDGDMAVYLDSLRRMGDLAEQHGSAVFVPAHGPVQRDGPAITRHYVAHRLAREAKIRKAVVEQGARDSLEIARLAYADTPGAPLPLAQMAVEAHLRKLIREGELVREGGRVRAASRT